MDSDSLQEIFKAIGPVSVRRMFGGQGIYSNGCIVALVVGGELLLKADGVTNGAFEAAGSRQWSYEREGKTPVRMPYFSIPDDAYDDPDIMAGWVRLAREAGERSLSARTARPSKTAKTKKPARSDPSGL